MQDLAELHRSSRPAMFLSDLGKPKASSPKNQVTTATGAGLYVNNNNSMCSHPYDVSPAERRQSEVRVQRGEEVRTVSPL